MACVNIDDMNSKLIGHKLNYVVTPGPLHFWTIIQDGNLNKDTKTKSVISNSRLLNIYHL